MKIENQEIVSRESVKDVKGINPLLESHNSLLDTFKLLTNKNIDIDNLQMQIKDVTVVTGADGYILNPIRFKTDMKVNVTGCTAIKCVIKNTFLPVEVSGCPAWEEINGEIIIKSMKGLAVNTTYLVRYKLE
jgi:hypothetical protein